MKKIAIPILLLAAVAAYVVYRQRETRANATATTVLYGNIEVREVELAFRQSGRLAEMKVDEGDRVQAGDVVAVLDDQPFKDALQVAEAEARRARAERDKLRAGSRAQELRSAEIAVGRAQAVLERARLDLSRQTELVGRGAASEKTLELARLTEREASAALASAEQALSLTREGPRKEDLSAAEARVNAAEAVLTQLRTTLADTILRAPSNGQIGTRVREPGSMIGVREPVYLLALRDPVYVRAYVGEPQLAQAQPGTAVTVQVDGVEHLYHGTIGFVAPRAEFTPKSVESTELRADLVYRLRIRLDDGDDQLRQGMPVTVTLAAAPTARAAR